MQIYEKYLKDSNFGRIILSEFLGFLKDKVDNGTLTLEEEQAILRLIEHSLPLSGTVDDLARYFRQEPGTIRTVIHRKLFAKPKRCVYYPFLDFLAIVPEKWLK